MDTTNERKKPLPIETIERNLAELQQRLEDFTAPTYIIQELYDPVAKEMVRNVRVNQEEWWEAWQRQVQWLPYVEKNGLLRLGRLRASTDDFCFMKIQDTVELIIQQIGLFKQHHMLTSQASSGEDPLDAGSAQQHDMELESALSTQDFPVLGVTVEPGAPGDDDGGEDERPSKSKKPKRRLVSEDNEGAS